MTCELKTVWFAFSFYKLNFLYSLKDLALRDYLKQRKKGYLFIQTQSYQHQGQSYYSLF